MVNRFAVLKVSSLILALLLTTFSITSVLADPSRAPELETITFIDVLRPGNVEGHVEGEACASSSSSFKTIRGGIRWRKESPVTYSVDTSGLVGLNGQTAAAAVAVAAESWDALDEGTFFDNVFPFTPNVDVIVSWAPIDGPGGTLAAAGLSFNPATKTIVSASITFDSLDDWTVYSNTVSCGEQFDGQDVENVGAHEFGHVIGTDHVNDDVDLTMYKFITQDGETRKRTLGIGDIAGFRALYLPGGEDPPAEDPPEDPAFCPPGQHKKGAC